MARIGELDLPDRLAPFLPRWATEIGTGLLCAGVAVIIRAVLDAIVPGGAVFALIFPAAMVATLFAGWRAGTIAGAVLIPYSWYFLYPVTGSFAFVSEAGLLSVISVTIACAMTVGIAELFRLAVRDAVAERDRELAERDLFLEEFDHRVKNNFAVVAGILDLQRRRTDDPGTAEALGTALTRIESIARAHRHLYRGQSARGMVEMRSYLIELCDALSESLFLGGTVQLLCNSDHAMISRDRAVSIGLIVNELVSNAAKHAFADSGSGEIVVAFLALPDGGYRLSVTDNGGGMAPETLAAGREGGLGKRLVEAFARQADGTITITSGPDGTHAVMDMA